MTKQQNEVTTENHFDAETGEIIITNEFQPKIISETDKYAVYQNPNGKFVRKAKYEEFTSVVPETRKEKMWLLNLMDSDENEGIGQSLKTAVGKELVIQDVITRKYDKINEDTGQLEYGVLTYLITPEKEVYVTSSKSPYFSIWNIMDLFGKPGTPEWENVKVKIGSVKLANGTGLTLKMIG